MKHSEETIRAAEEYSKKGPYGVVTNHAFLAGAEHKQKDVDELVEALKALRGLIDEKRNPQTYKAVNELIQKHAK